MFSFAYSPDWYLWQLTQPINRQGKSICLSVSHVHHIFVSLCTRSRLGPAHLSSLSIPHHSLSLLQLLVTLPIINSSLPVVSATLVHSHVINRLFLLLFPISNISYPSINWNIAWINPFKASFQMGEPQASTSRANGAFNVSLMDFRRNFQKMKHFCPQIKEETIAAKLEGIISAHQKSQSAPALSCHRGMQITDVQ